MLVGSLLLPPLCLALTWTGEYIDPDDLHITLDRSGNNLAARSVDWEIAGEVVTENQAELAGLIGVLSETGVLWSNGMHWKRFVRPPTWPGQYHAMVHDIDVRLTLTSATQAKAFSSSFSKPMTGTINGDTIDMFGLKGQLRARISQTGDDIDVIEWSNKEVWNKPARSPASPPQPPPPPPPLPIATTGSFWASGAARTLPKPMDAMAAHIRGGSPADVQGRGEEDYYEYEAEDMDASMGVSASSSLSSLGASQPQRGDGGVRVSGVGGTGTGTGTGGGTGVGGGGVGGVGGGARGGDGGGGGGGGMLFVALVLIAMGGSGVFVATSFRRHGAIDVQLLRDDAKASLSWVRAVSPLHLAFLPPTPSAPPASLGAGCTILPFSCCGLCDARHCRDPLATMHEPRICMHL